MQSLKTDIVVIGSGISGLTAAALLARHGKSVIVLEQTSKPGGALKRFKRQGIPFDTGFHYTGGLGKGQILRLLWDYLGLSSRPTAVSFGPDGHDRILIRESGREVRAYFSYKRLTDELNRHFPDDRHGIEAYFNALQKCCGQAPFFNLDLELTPFLHGLFRPQSISLGDFLSRNIKSRELQAVLAAPAFLHGIPPKNVSMTMHALVAHSYYYGGAYGIRGGGQAIADAFCDLLYRQGVEILTNQRADLIRAEGGRTSGVLSTDYEITANHVIYTGHPVAIFSMVPKGFFRPAYIHRVQDLTNTDSMFILFGKLDNSDLATEANLCSVPAGLDLLNTDPLKGSLFLTAPGARDGKDSAAARGVILMRPASWLEAVQFLPHNRHGRLKGYQEWKEEQTKLLLERARQSWGNGCGITSLAAGSPLTFHNRLHAPYGTIYGVQHNLHQITATARTKLPGFLLSGQSTLMTGIMGASLAGLVTAGEIIGLETLWNKVRSYR